jgi:branched-chain amino acid transport system substrate-binding protein
MRMRTIHRLALLALALTALLLAGCEKKSEGPKEIVIGVIYPMSGPVAQVGADAAAAVNAMVDIVNNKHEGLNIPLAAGEGLPNLGGAKVRVIIADHQGKPEVGQGEAERLITQEKVAALFGSYYSSVTATASQVAERMQVPMVNGESTSPQLTERGFKWFFRTGPHDGEFTQVMYDFIKDYQAKKGIKLNSVGILHEDTLWGADSGKVQEVLAKEANYKVTNNIAYRAKTTSMTSEVQLLKAASPDVLLPSSYTPDALLFMRTAKELDYNPRLLIAQNAGYTDPTLLETLGSDAEGVITRSPFNYDLAGQIPLIGKVNEIFRKHSNNRDLSDVPVRAFIGFMTLVDAINRAGSTDPEKIREALANTNIPGEQLMVPWSGVQFGENGHNKLVRGLLMQVQNGKYCTIYPFEVSACEVLYPMPSWKDKAKMK